MAQEFNVMQLIKFVVYNLHMKFLNINNMPIFPSEIVGFHTNMNLEGINVEDDTGLHGKQELSNGVSARVSLMHQWRKNFT